MGYGLTETAAIVASIFTKEETERYGSSGLLAPNVEGKIVDPDTGRVLGVHRTGELWLQSPTVMKGFVFVVDRLKELIKCNGYQVAAAELEALLLVHPEIADAAVIPIPDLKAGQYPMAYIVSPYKRIREKSLSKLNIDFAQPKQQVYSKSLRPSFVTVRAMSESQTALKNQPQSSASSGKKQALISLSDKYTIVSSGGTASTLENAGVCHFQKKQLDGRVKSLHPNIHGGILARRDVEHHMEALNEHGIEKCPFLHCLHFSIILVSLRLLQDPFFICFDSDVSAL
ncbi:hypothetical protein YC2023_055759 [Brassica napus]